MAKSIQSTIEDTSRACTVGGTVEIVHHAAILQGQESNVKVDDTCAHSKEREHTQLQQGMYCMYEYAIGTTINAWLAILLYARAVDDAIYVIHHGRLLTFER